MSGNIILVIGGARSGKSRYAEQRVRDCGGRRFYVATAPVCDDEMAKRIKRHRELRAADGWTTIEEEVDLDAALRQAAAAGADAVLVDCLTLWINNLLYRDETFSEDRIAERCGQLLQTMRSLPQTTVLVIGEVGLGMVPESPLARRFRDLSGRCAQVIAAEADEVYFMVAGIQQRIK